MNIAPTVPNTIVSRRPDETRRLRQTATVGPAAQLAASRMLRQWAEEEAASRVRSKGGQLLPELKEVKPQPEPTVSHEAVTALLPEMAGLLQQACNEAERAATAGTTEHDKAVIAAYRLRAVHLSTEDIERLTELTVAAILMRELSQRGLGQAG